MKVTFYCASVESLGIELLSAILKKQGHEVTLAFDAKVLDDEALHVPFLSRLFSYSDLVIDQIVDSRPDLLCLSLFTFNYQAGLKVARAIKSRLNVPVIIGGVHATLVPERVIAESCVDMVCVGEGEEALLELASTFDLGQDRTDIRNIWFKRNGQVIRNESRPLLADLDSWPIPDKKLFYSQLPLFAEDYSIITSLGCAYKCAYCSNNALRGLYAGKGRFFRRRSVAHVLAELEWAKREFSPRRITFADDLFAGDIRWLREFVPEYRKRVGIPIAIQIHPRFLTPEVAKLLKDAGCSLAALGVQSTVPETRKSVLLRPESLDEIREATRICHEAGLKFSVDHMLNLPGEKKEDLVLALNFYNEIRPNSINGYWLQYFPKCQIIADGIKEGCLTPADIESIENGTFSSSVVVGLGRSDPTIRNRLLFNYHFLLVLIPLLPRKLMQRIIDRGWFQSARFRPPMVLNALIKGLVALKAGRAYVYVNIFRKTFFCALKKRQLKAAARNRHARSAQQAGGA